MLTDKLEQLYKVYTQDQYKQAVLASKPSENKLQQILGVYDNYDFTDQDVVSELESVSVFQIIINCVSKYFSLPLR